MLNNEVKLSLALVACFIPRAKGRKLENPVWSRNLLRHLFSFCALLLVQLPASLAAPQLTNKTSLQFSEARQLVDSSKSNRNFNKNTELTRIIIKKTLVRIKIRNLRPKPLWYEIGPLLDPLWSWTCYLQLNNMRQHRWESAFSSKSSEMSMDQYFRRLQ